MSHLHISPSLRKRYQDSQYADPAMPDFPTALWIGAPDRKGSDQLLDSDANELIRALGKAIEGYPPGKPYTVSVEGVPVTVERVPYFSKDEVMDGDGKKGSEDVLVDPGTARANVAATKESPYGTQEGGWAKKHEHMTVVQQHSAYWDADGDGIIWPQDTYRGIRAWGWAIPLALFATFVINFNLSYPTAPTFLPDPFFRIWLSRIHKDKHGSDSMSFDNEGRFRPQNFEDFFAKYDKGNKGGLDLWDLARGLKGQRMAFDFFGWAAAFLEWLATYLLIWPDDGILRKEDVRRVFDGSLFQWKADEYAEKQRKKRSGQRSGLVKWNARVQKAVKGQ